MKKLFIKWIKSCYRKIPGLNFFVSKLKVSSIFWKYRHVFDNEVWEDYLKDYRVERRNFYSDFVKNKSLNFIFEFGCASGPNLMNIEKNVNHSVFLVGYDININALKKAKGVFNPKNSLFISDLNPVILEKILKSKDKLFFDLVIFDRVFFLLNEDEINNHLLKFSKFYNYIIIDDFHNEKKNIKFGTYRTKNFIKLFSNFELVSIENSAHKVNNEFFRLNAKRIIFKNSNL